MKIQKLAGVLLCMSTMTLAACNGGTIYKKDTFGAFEVLSVDARQRLVIQGERIENGHRRPIICTEPSPDAIVAQAANLAASTNVPFSGDRTANAQLAAGFSESAASIAMRTQTIQLLRDGYFRLCEAYLNGALDKEHYLRISMFIDEFIATVVAIEALGGTVVVPPAGIIASQGIIVNKDGTIEVKPEAAQVEVDYKAPPASTVNADAIKEILNRYYKRKAEFQSIHMNF